MYCPADAERPYHALYFAHGFFSSALHESAHWLIAGDARRQVLDFGYWYEPDGRSPEQQALFQQVEIKPQALEWILSVAAGHRFQVSIDNLDAPPSDTVIFQRNVYEQVLCYCDQGLPERAEIFRRALCAHYGTSLVLDKGDFDIKRLGISSYSTL